MTLVLPVHARTRTHKHVLAPRQPFSALWQQVPIHARSIHLQYSLHIPSKRKFYMIVSAVYIVILVLIFGVSIIFHLIRFVFFFHFSPLSLNRAPVQGVHHSMRAGFRTTDSSRCISGPGRVLSLHPSF